MTYDRFVMSILERVQKGVGDSVSVSVYTAVKNNGTKRKGLTLTEKGVNITPKAIPINRYPVSTGIVYGNAFLNALP